MKDILEGVSRLGSLLVVLGFYKAANQNRDYDSHSFTTVLCLGRTVKVRVSRFRKKIALSAHSKQLDSFFSSFCLFRIRFCVLLQVVYVKKQN
jgi:hypothetical protein